MRQIGKVSSSLTANVAVSSSSTFESLGIVVPKELNITISVSVTPAPESLTNNQPNRVRHLLTKEEWEEVFIASEVHFDDNDYSAPGAYGEIGFRTLEARGAKCDRCWRVLPEVGDCSAHPTLCRRCDAVVEAL